ncbi:MAG: response regulator PleD [Myxococcales bacterium]
MLYVDEDVLSARSAARVLERAGYLVDVVRSANFALDQMAKQHYDAVLTELTMSEIDGAQFISRGHALHPSAVFVAVTTHEDPEGYLTRLPERCVVGVLNKPWTAPDLLDMVERAVRVSAHRGHISAPSRSLLLLEDRLSQTDLIRAYLLRGAPHYSLTCTPTLREALELLRRERFDLILTDLNLPDARGLDAVRRLFASSGLPIVAMSESIDPLIGAQALELGASDFLPKDELSPRTLKRILEHSLLRAEARRQLEELAFRDALTGLSNARYLRDRLALAVSGSRRTGSPCALIFVDLDGFKPVNDAFGHAAGDFVLQTVARRLDQELRGVDTLARIGGDEFAVLLEGVESAEAVTAVAARLLKVIAEPVPWKQDECSVSASAGIALYSGAGDTPESLLRSADSSMYEAKRLGPGRFAITRGGLAPCQLGDEPHDATG